MKIEINANKRELQGTGASRRLRRAGALQFALVCDDLDFHWLTPEKTRPRPGGG